MALKSAARGQHTTLQILMGLLLVIANYTRRATFEVNVGASLRGRPALRWHANSMKLACDARSGARPLSDAPTFLSGEQLVGQVTLAKITDDADDSFAWS